MMRCKKVYGLCSVPGIPPEVAVQACERQWHPHGFGRVIGRRCVQELMVLGTVSLIVFVVFENANSAHLDEETRTSLELIHLCIFVVAFLYART